MNRFQRKGLAAASSLAVLMALAACGQQTTEQAAADPATAPAATDQTARAPKATADDAGAATTSADAGASDTSVLGAGAAKVDDAQITTKVNAGLAADKDLSAIRIDVDTRDGVVTLSGPVPTATAKERASEIARNVQDVKSVNNQLNVGPG